jgi:hypothetical protein
MAEHSPAGGQSQPHYETTDARITPLVQTAVFVALLMVVSIFGMIVLFKVFAYYQPLFDDPVPPLAETRLVSDEPRLQPDPPRQKFDLRHQEDQMLNSYGWVDQQVRVVRIPIDRAIDLVASGKLSIAASGPQVK